MPVTEPVVIRQNAVDARGRVIPLTDAEVLARAESIARGLDALDDLGDEFEQRETLDALIRGIDEDRPSDRRRFRE